MNESSPYILNIKSVLSGNPVNFTENLTDLEVEYNINLLRRL
jgi:hypothetical protein